MQHSSNTVFAMSSRKQQCKIPSATTGGPPLELHLADFGYSVCEIMLGGPLQQWGARSKITFGAEEWNSTGGNNTACRK